jgi:hypothetical protein
LTQKPHRFLINRVSSYADEAGAYLRRRRLRGRPFARIWLPGGAIVAADVETPVGERILAAAEDLLEPSGDDS